MVPGPDTIIACRKCGGLASVPSLYSGNTFGARWWTDGKIVAPMLPETPEITRCHICTAYYWVAEAHVVTEIDAYFLEPEELGEVPEEWRDAKRIRELSEEEYLQVLAEGLGKPQKRELYLRVRAWWAGNDRYRSQQPGEPAPPRRLVPRKPRRTSNASSP
jgi:hypothetical protein